MFTARKIIIGLVVLSLLLAVGFTLAESAHAAPLTGGDVAGFTNAPATVTNFVRYPFYNVVTVKVEYSSVEGMRYTSGKWIVGERVYVTGIARYGWLQWFRMHR